MNRYLPPSLKFDETSGDVDDSNIETTVTQQSVSMVNPITDTDGKSPYNWRTSDDTATSFPMVDGEIYYGDA